MTTLESASPSAGVEAMAPGFAATTALALSAVREITRTLCPARVNCLVKAAPMLPAPRMVMFMCGSLVFDERVGEAHCIGYINRDKYALERRIVSENETILEQDPGNEQFRGG